MESYLSDLLENYGRHALWLVPAFAFAEACIGIGLFVSGAFLVIVGTTLLSTDTATLAQMVPLAMLGAVAGDHIGYYVGYWVGPRFHHTRLAARYATSLQRAERMIQRYGALAVFIGRFIPAIRSLVPGLLGVTGFSRLRFTVYDTLACLGWSLALGAILAGANGLLN